METSADRDIIVKIAKIAQDRLYCLTFVEKSIEKLADKDIGRIVTCALISSFISLMAWMVPPLNNRIQSIGLNIGIVGMATAGIGMVFEIGYHENMKGLKGRLKLLGESIESQHLAKNNIKQTILG